MLNKTDRDDLRLHIENELEKVKGDIVSLKEQAGPVEPDNAIGRISRMDAIGARKISEAKLRDAKSRLVLLPRKPSRVSGVFVVRSWCISRTTSQRQTNLANH